MYHEIIYADGARKEEFIEWDAACDRFSWLCKVWPEVSARYYCPRQERHIEIARYSASPYVVMNRMREEYWRSHHIAGVGKMV